MFGWKDKAEITTAEPQFSVRYAGSTETFTATGAGCTAVPVQRVWDNSQDERHMRRCELLITPAGILLLDADRPTDGGTGVTRFDIQDISYVSADLVQHERVFSWVSRQPGTRRLLCHVVVCSSKEKARTVAVVMSRAFQIAYKDWKGNQQRQARLKQRHVGNQQLMSTTSGVNIKDGRTGSDEGKGSDVNGNLGEGKVLNVQRS